MNSIQVSSDSIQGTPSGLKSRVGPRGRSVGNAILIAILVLIATGVILSWAVNPFLRSLIENRMNQNMKGHRTSLSYAHISIAGVLSLGNLTIIQSAQPSPPIIHIKALRVAIEWLALLRGNIVADCLIDEPDIHINLAQLSREASGKIYILPPGWQDTLRHIHPFTIHRMQVRDANVMYIDTDPDRPLLIQHAYFAASDIRNINSQNDPYPSPVTARFMVLGDGHATIHGRANVFAAPFPNVLINYNLNRVPLAALSPSISRFHLSISGGILATDGVIEHSPTVERAEVNHAAIDQLNVEYIHKKAIARSEAPTTGAEGATARRGSHAANLVFKVNQAQITNGTIAYRDEAGSSAYQLYVTKLKLLLSHLSNQAGQSTCNLKLEGLFMGNGETTVVGDFRPSLRGPDFDIMFAMKDMQLPSLNDLFRRYGRLEVESGQFSVYSQSVVRDGQISGYIKPLFSNVQFHKSEHDKGESGLRKVYQGTVKGAAELLRNPKTETVATKIDLSGKIEKPKLSTIQALLQLINNAFAKAIVPGFDQQQQLYSPSS
jgi:Domain of Unknown Function (DUF748)